MSGKIRIEADGLSGNQGRVFYIAEDGTETEISGVITGLDLKMRVSEINQVTLYGLFTGAKINAELEQFVVDNIRPIRVNNKPMQDDAA